MDHFCFKYMDKHKTEELLHEMFDILYSNMNPIAPTGNSYDADFHIWLSHISHAIQMESRKTVLMYAENELVGYFRYFMNSSTQSLLMEDVQIKPKFQGVGLFSYLCKWLINQLPGRILTVEAYADKKNDKSQSVLEHLGLKRKGENENGISFYYQGDYASFCSIFCSD